MNLHAWLCAAEVDLSFLDNGRDFTYYLQATKWFCTFFLLYFFFTKQRAHILSSLGYRYNVLFKMCNPALYLKICWCWFSSYNGGRWEVSGTILIFSEGEFTTCSELNFYCQFGFIRTRKYHLWALKLYFRRVVYSKSKQYYKVTRSHSCYILFQNIENILTD